MKRLLEWLAPHDFDDPDGDDRTFAARFYDSDQRRSESPNTRWASRYAPPRPYWELTTGWLWTNWKLGVSAQYERWHPSHVWVSLALGPWSIALSREWKWLP